LVWKQKFIEIHEGKIMTFKLSRRSLDRLEGVDERLQAVAKHAITLTKTDFGVIQGLRTLDEQKELVAKGASKTMKSLHLEGKAIDVMAFVNSRASWRWGAAWHIDDIRKWEGTMEEAMNAYIDLRRSQGKRPFIDGPHFEIRE
jgi:peptidoglycan L-alanyl-D-glutamate endopeptidase CwlK